MTFKGGQMSKSISILIPTRRAFEAIELTIESVLARTWYDNFRIIVCDNSQGKGEGNRLEYLKQHEKNGTIKLIESMSGTGAWKLEPGGLWRNDYGHGSNLKILLKACETDYAVLLSSGIEVLKTSWLEIFMDIIKTNKDLGAARYRAAASLEDSWIAPCWWPNLMILNMKLYREIMDDSDWDLGRMAYADYPYKHLFDNIKAPEKFDQDGEMIFLDTGYNLWKRLEYDNPKGYKMINFDTVPAEYQWRHDFNFYIGLDRNSHRPEHPFVRDQRVSIKERLRILRCQS